MRADLRELRGASLGAELFSSVEPSNPPFGGLQFTPNANLRVGVEEWAVAAARCRCPAVPFAAVPAAAVPDAIVPEAIVPDAPVPDAAAPVATVPDATVPGYAASEVPADILVARVGVE